MRRTKIKSYFEWQTPLGFRPRKSTDQLKKLLRPAIFGSIISILLFAIVIIVPWIFLALRHNRFFFTSYLLLLYAAIFFFLIPISFPIQILLTLWRGPRTRLKVRVCENIIVFSKGHRGFFKYEDVQSFHIEKEEFKGETISILEMETFDGDSVGLGLSPDIPIDQLVGFLSDRILEARKVLRGLFARKAGAKHRLAGLILMYLGSIVFLALLATSAEHGLGLEKRFENEPAKRTTESKTSQLTERQLKTKENPREQSLSTELLVEPNQMLVGMLLSTSMFLFGCVLMLWGEHKFLKAKITRLQAFYSDIHFGMGVQHQRKD
jgi:hypothetical protein